MRHAPAGSLREVEHAGHDALLQQPAADEFKFELGARAQQSALVSGLAGAAAKDPRFNDVSVGHVDAAEGDEAG